ncbi:MAG TPA: FKBP-type peptidyl-prolyl cis-trans isomerase, partial [Bacteroidales bacterium]
KVKFLVSILAISLVVLSACNKKSTVKLRNDVDSASYAIGVSIGANLQPLDMPAFNAELFKQAVMEAMAKKEHKMTQEQIQMFLQQYFTNLQKKQAEASLKKNEEFLKKNKERKGVITTASGLQYEVLREGTGATPKAEDMVTINYKGTLIDGTVFDSSYERKEPITFAVNGVIPGFSEALQLMKVGSNYKIYIPSQLGYGPNPQGKIKPNSLLIFEVELLSISTPEQKKEEAKKQ